MQTSNSVLKTDSQVFSKVNTFMNQPGYTEISCHENILLDRLIDLVYLVNSVRKYAKWYRFKIYEKSESKHPVDQSVDT